MQFETKKYFRDAALIVGNNVSPLFIPAILGIFLYVPGITDEQIDFSTLFPMMLLLVAYPLVYGQYAEIVINNRQGSYYKIFTTHWLNYFIVSIIIGAPALLIVSLLSFSFPDNSVILKHGLSAIVNSLTIYIFPLVFLLKQKMGSIFLGIKCLFGNFQFNLPLIIVALFPTILGIMIGYPLESTDNSTNLSVFFNYAYWLFCIYIDFLVFTAATLILKEKMSHLFAVEIVENAENES